ncbi:MAG: hypothetical protein ACO2ZZ_04240 [Cyclobacteriaceae bacterium]
MTKSTRNLLRLISVIVVAVLVLMELGIVTEFFNYSGKFWIMIASYGVLLFTMQR